MLTSILVAQDSIRDCFLENTTVTHTNGTQLMSWYAERNSACKELGLHREYCDSVPLSLDKDQIRAFLEASKSSVPWK